MASVRAKVLQEFPKTGKDILPANVGAISIYHMKVADVDVRELAMLLCFADGGSHMRCRCGGLCFSGRGAFYTSPGVAQAHPSKYSP